MRKLLFDLLILLAKLENVSQKGYSSESTLHHFADFPSLKNAPIVDIILTIEYVDVMILLPVFFSFTLHLCD